MEQTLDLNISTVQHIVAFCAEEVRRQGRGAIQVGNMVDAWLDALKGQAADPDLTLAQISAWGKMVEPSKRVAYDGDWRSVDVWIGHTQMPSPFSVPFRMIEWLDKTKTLTPEQAYLAFEMIHPFPDGNGRVGKIIYNWMSNSLEEPKWPPDFFGGIANP